MTKISYDLSKQIVYQVQLDPLLGFHLSNLKKYRRDTYNHSLRVALLSVDMGHSYSLDDHDLVNLGYAGLLHEDQRNSKVPVGILSKLFPLTHRESLIINTHPKKYFLQLSELPQEVREIIGAHHKYKKNPIQERRVEKNTSQEVRRRYNNPEILFLSQILALCDLYDSLESGRTYKSVKNKEKRIELIRENFLGYKSLIDRL